MSEWVTDRLTLDIGVMSPTSTPDPTQLILGDVRASLAPTGLGSRRDYEFAGEPHAAL